MTLSIAQLFLALAAFTVVSFAWFAISPEVESEPIQFSTSHEFIEGYEIKFYTKNHTYKYIPEEQEIYIYDDDILYSSEPYYPYVDPSIYCEGSVCETPSYGYLDKTYQFDGIFLDIYDPLIPVNNEDNYLFVELHLDYQVPVTNYLTLQGVSNPALATGSVFGDPTSGHYLSEVVNIQYLSSYTTYETTNTFDNLKDTFIVNGVYSSSYPAQNFYISGVYNSTFDFTGSIELSPLQTSK